MKIKIDNSEISDRDWEDVDKTELANELEDKAEAEKPDRMGTYPSLDQMFTRSLPLGAFSSNLGNGELALASAFALAGLLLLPPGPALRGSLLAGVVTLWLGRLLQRRLGGYTGDCLGATQQGAELAFYLGLLWTFS